MVVLFLIASMCTKSNAWSHLQFLVADPEPYVAKTFWLNRSRYWQHFGCGSDHHRYNQLVQNLKKC
jgi:hypothetical protein